MNANEKIVENMTLTYAGIKNEVLTGQSNFLPESELAKEKEPIKNQDFLLLLFNSTAYDVTPTLKTFQYVENFLQFRLHIDSIQVMAYDFGLNKLPVKFGKHPEFNNEEFVAFVKDKPQPVDEGVMNKKIQREIIVYEEIDRYAEGSKLNALDLIHFAMRESTMKHKIDKDFQIRDEDKENGVSLIGLMEGREAHEAAELKEKEVILARDI